MQAIRSMFLMTEKRDTPGNLVKVKARLVAAGLTQQLKLWEDTASPTMRTEHLAVLLQLAVENRDYISTIDVSGAYLHATIYIDVFMIIPAHYQIID